MNYRRLWTEYLTSIGQGATVFVAAFPIVNEINCALLFSLCSMYLLPASCEGRGGEPVCYFKIVKIVVSVKAIGTFFPQ